MWRKQLEAHACQDWNNSEGKFYAALVIINAITNVIINAIIIVIILYVFHWAL